MKRRTLDFIFVVGGVVMAILLAVLGLVLKSNANFAKNYVHDQLREQQIKFPTADKLQTHEQLNTQVLASFNGDQAAVDAWFADNDFVAPADAKCMVKYAGTALDSGKKAECYANYYIRLHLGDGAIYASKFSANPDLQKPHMYTYASIGTVQSELRTLAADAKKNNAANAADIQAELDKVNTLRSDTLFRGETLRGLLLTSYGFSVFGEKADLAALVLYMVGVVLLLASVAGLVHAAKTPKTQMVGHAHDHEKVEPVRV
jgi:hypothetical protein